MHPRILPPPLLLPTLLLFSVVSLEAAAAPPAASFARARTDAASVCHHRRSSPTARRRRLLAPFAVEPLGRRTMALRFPAMFLLGSSLPALAEADGESPALPGPAMALDGTEPKEEKKLTAIERLKEKQRKALEETQQKAEKIQYEDGSVTLIYPKSVLEDLRLKDPVVRQRLASPGRGGVPKDGFPYFVRDGYTMKMFIEDDFKRTSEGLNYKILASGRGGPTPQEGQKVTFDFKAYNENGDQIDSSLRKNEPPSAKIGLGTIVPGVEIALRQMTVGERWRIIVSPDLGPPTGPSTFFSAKQYETFDIELKAIQNCEKEQTVFVTNEKCTDVA